MLLVNICDDIKSSSLVLTSTLRLLGSDKQITAPPLLAPLLICHSQAFEIRQPAWQTGASAQDSISQLSHPV